VHDVYTIRGPSIGCHFLFIDALQSTFSRNAKCWPTIVVSVKNTVWFIRITCTQNSSKWRK